MKYMGVKLNNQQPLIIIKNLRSGKFDTNLHQFHPPSGNLWEFHPQNKTIVGIFTDVGELGK
jgi:hypothetical protein